MSPPHSNPMLNPPTPFGYHPYRKTVPNHAFYAAPYDNMLRQDSASDIVGDPNSLMGFPQGVPFEQARGGGMVVDPRDAKGILAPQPMTLPPLPPPLAHMMKQNYYSGEHGHDGQDVQSCVAGCGKMESAQHLSISCSTFGFVWSSIRSWIGVFSVDPHNLVEHFLPFTFSARGLRAC
ncbi:E3 ubiquitin-protein ligase Hakai-like protein [Trifolium pratense]|uniref:E3 ubiquitin-protein ligase Hakai-like protein n=1 Tax=Trifolium pratense TaxID=57577 RepID=A0A2K3NGD0_TRIPR|nr:E3 ubiquitin-protein ligase Hakai-like protein [Trifolium pratense]